MTASADMASDVLGVTSLPQGAAPLDAIVRTEELSRRPSRPPDYARENQALVALMAALADSPATILQTLADRVLEVLHADSAGLSLLTKDEQRFYWAAIAGAWSPHAGGGTPRNFGPCGDVLDRNAPMLFTHWERRYPYLQAATPLADEGLLVPFYVRGKAVGTIWAITHTNGHQFDAEDLRLLESLAQFASAAYQAVESIEDLRDEIVARQKAEIEVRQLVDRLEAKIRCLVDSSIIGIFIWNLDGRILESNDAFLQLVGHGRDELDAGLLRWADMTPEDWHEADEQSLAEIKATGTVRTYEKELFRKDGTRVPVLIGGAAFAGSADHGAAFVLDLTLRKRAEAIARESERRYHEIQTEMAHANRVAIIGQLSASIVHEVNQPLSSILVNASTGLRMLASDPTNANGAREAMERTIQDTKRASDVIKRLHMLFAKTDRATELMDLNEATKEVIALFRPELQKSAINLRCKLAGNLPAIVGDRVQLQQVILNLVRNALEAMSTVDNRPRELQISTARTESNEILLIVKDSGSGIDPANAERIFEAFYTTKPRGLGMGLSICRAIIEAHDGKLWATPGVPNGTIFRLVLPAGTPR